MTGSITRPERKTGRGVRNEHTLSVRGPRTGAWGLNTARNREGPLIVRTPAARGLIVVEALRSRRLNPEGSDIGAVASSDIGATCFAEALDRQGVKARPSTVHQRASSRGEALPGPKELQ